MNIYDLDLVKAKVVNINIRHEVKDDNITTVKDKMDEITLLVLNKSKIYLIHEFEFDGQKMGVFVLEWYDELSQENTRDIIVGDINIIG